MKAKGEKEGNKHLCVAGNCKSKFWPHTRLNSVCPFSSLQCAKKLEASRCKNWSVLFPTLVFSLVHSNTNFEGCWILEWRRMGKNEQEGGNEGNPHPKNVECLQKLHFAPTDDHGSGEPCLSGKVQIHEVIKTLREGRKLGKTQAKTWATQKLWKRANHFCCLFFLLGLLSDFLCSFATFWQSIYNYVSVLLSFWLARLSLILAFKLLGLGIKVKRHCGLSSHFTLVTNLI